MDLKILEPFIPCRIAGDDPAGHDPVAAGVRVAAARGLLRQQPPHLHRLLQEDPRRQRTGEE